MKKSINYIFCLLLIFTTTSCKSQVKNLNPKIYISAIKDSVICKEGNESFKITYSLPKLNLDNKNSQKTLNTLIYQELQNNAELFEFVENDTLKVTTEIGMKLITNKIKANCSPSYYGFGEINLYYVTQFIKLNFISIEVFKESYISSYHQSIHPINLDLKKNKLLTIDDIIRIDKKKLLAKKIDSITQKTVTEDLLYYKEKQSENYLDAVNNIKMFYKGFTLNDLNSFILTTKDNIDGLLFIYSLGYPQSFKSLEPTFDLFYTLDELKPYLTKEFKEQLDI